MKSLLTNKVIQKYVLVWLAYWLSVMGFNIFILKPSGINFLQNTHWIVIYFLFFSLFGFFLLKKVGAGSPLENAKKQIPTIIFSGLVFVIFSYQIGLWLPLKPEASLTIEKMRFYYPLLFIRTSIAKYADIIFQQTLIISMVLFLKKNCQRSREVVEAFTFIFFVLHIPLFLEFGLKALIFIIPSLFAGAIFSFLITFYSWGALGSMLVHQYYYIAMAIIFRLIYKG